MLAGEPGWWGGTQKAHAIAFVICMTLGATDDVCLRSWRSDGPRVSNLSLQGILIFGQGIPNRPLTGWSRAEGAGA